MEDLDPRGVAQGADDMVRGRGFVHETLRRLVEEARATVGDDDEDLITEMVLRRVSTDPTLAKAKEALTLMVLEPILEEVLHEEGFVPDPDSAVWRKPGDPRA